MTTATSHLYEIMILIGQGTAARLSEVLDHINTLFERSKLEVVSMQKWDERRLAYEINKQKRGVYLLAYVNGEPESIAGFERDCNLSEEIMRALVLRADHLTLEEAQAFDRRDDLQVEAKMRAETAREEEEKAKSSGAVLGAPPTEEEAKAAEATDAEAPAAESPEAEADAEDDKGA